MEEELTFITTMCAGRFTPHASVAVQTNTYRKKGGTSDKSSKLKK